MARDVTIFTDESVTCDGPIVPGPALDEWVAGRGPGAPPGRRTGDSRPPRCGPEDFASRQIQSHYLRWAYDRAVGGAPGPGPGR